MTASSASFFYCDRCNKVEYNLPEKDVNNWKILGKEKNYFPYYIFDRSFDFAREIPLRPGTDRTYTVSLMAVLTGSGTTGIEFHHMQPSPAKKEHLKKYPTCLKKSLTPLPTSSKVVQEVFHV